MQLKQDFESARVVHQGPVLCVCANEMQLITGDGVGVVVVQQPKKYKDMVQASERLST